MGIDAVALIRPKKPSLLRGVLDPETASVDVLDDGSLLLSTFVRYRDIEQDVDTGRAVLSQYGQGLIDAHDDARGIFFFPDVCEPRGRTYDAVLTELKDAGVWVPAMVLTNEELEARGAALLKALEAEPPVGAAGFGGPAGAQPFAFPTISLEALTKQLGEMLSAPETVAKLVGLTAMGCAAIVLQRRSRAPLEPPIAFGVNEARELSDGTLVVLTDRGGQDGGEMVALALGESSASWMAEHDDPRGVPAFMAGSLDLVAGAKDYEDAVAKLGDRVTFLRPHTIDDLIAERKARLRSLLDS